MRKAEQQAKKWKLEQNATLIQGKRKRRRKTDETDYTPDEINDILRLESNENDNTNEIIALRKRVKQLQQKNRRLEPNVNDTLNTSAARKRAERVRKTLPQSPSKWADTLNRVLKMSTPKKKAALDGLQKKQKRSYTPKGQKERTMWSNKVKDFLIQDNMSRQMPNKRDVIKVGGVPVPKRHLTCSKKQAYLQFIDNHPNYPYKYTTFRKSIPRFVKQMTLKDRRVCVCLQCFNFKEKLRPLNRIAALSKLEPLSIRSSYKNSVCNYSQRFPNPECIESRCQACSSKLQNIYKEMINEKGTLKLRYTQWEKVKCKYTNSKNKVIEGKVWRQVDHEQQLDALMKEVIDDMRKVKVHLFQNDFQYYQHQNMISNLPLNHAVVYADFSQNYTLTPNDEIESAHYAQGQVTLHPF